MSNALVPIALYGWVPLVLLAFASLPPRRAAILAYMLGWLFLPVAQFDLPGYPDWDKTSATNLGVFLGMLLFDPRRLRGLALGPIDLAMLVWCACPIASSLTNGLGAYDGFAHCVRQTVTWGLPYLVGRRYFASWEGARELAVACLLGGLVYVPLCLWEIRMSPQLHAIVYGFHQHDFSQTLRGSGFRPTVFMNHGLMVGMWMSMSALVGVALWWSGDPRRVGPLPMRWAVALLVVTAVLCKSLGALVLLALGACVLWALGRLRSALPLAVLLAIPPLYMFARASGLWTGASAIELASVVSAERAESLHFRMEEEDLLVTHALERPLFGWGGYGRNLVMRDAEAGIVTIVDGLWVLVLGQNGLLGLLSFGLALIGPVLAFAFHVPPRLWTRPQVLPTAVLALILGLFMIDSLFNGMVNPIYVLIAGGLAPLRLAPARERAGMQPVRSAEEAGPNAPRVGVEGQPG